MAKNAEALTNERNKTHGNFEDVALTSSSLLAVMMQSKQWYNMSDARREAIKMITHKLARIGAGDFSHAEHWDDIGGYALLGKRDGQHDKEKPRAKVAATSLKKARATRKPKGKKAKTGRARVQKTAKKGARTNSRKGSVRRPAPVQARRSTQRPARPRPALAPVAQAAE